MSKYTIKHTCGHTSERDIVGRVCERQSKADYFASQECGKCWYAAKKAKEDEFKASCNAVDLDVVFEDGVEQLLAATPEDRKQQALEVVKIAREYFKTCNKKERARDYKLFCEDKPVLLVRDLYRAALK